ncbi:short-chain dehydrogenase/reductase SDR [gamma proteobacterium NOR5-3]|nr:short-chain dehydrogenase/reductase SDR [gamma proteobacterium NOR5-3]
MDRLKGKVAVVTGAAQGIGAAYAKGLASEGARVVVCDLSEPTEIVAQINGSGGEAMGIVADVTDDESLNRLVVEVEENFGPIEILVNNAAIFASIQFKPFTELSNEEWDAVMRVNARGPFQATKAVLPSMKKNGRGKVINIASGTFLRGAPMFCHYVASKGAVVGQTRSLARELGSSNVYVNCIMVGLTESEGVAASKQYDMARSATHNMRIIQRDMVPEDLLGTLYYLASEDSDFISGQCVNVDGGALSY